MHEIQAEHWSRRYPEHLLEHAAWLRALALEIDADPQSVMQRVDHPLFALLTRSEPPGTLDRVRLFEALAYGDAGALLSGPGPGFPGVIVRELGSPAQQQVFFDTVSERRARTFLAVAEPAKVSDAAGMTCRIDAAGRLTGEKWLVGHAASGEIGVAMVRTGNGPFSLGALLLTPDVLSDRTRLERHSLPMPGLKGALLGHMSFSGLQLGADALLGAHLHPLQRGMAALIRTFSRFRPCVASMALGHAQAMADYARIQLHGMPAQAETLDAWDARLCAARRLVHLAAAEADRAPDAAPHISLASVTATRICEAIADDVPGLLGTRALLDHPWLEKAVRDALAFECLEGATNIHLDQTGALPAGFPS